MKALVGAFNQEKDIVGAFSVFVKPMDRFTALEEMFISSCYGDQIYPCHMIADML